MSKEQKTDKQDAPKESASTSSKQTYFFPNDGQPFSCEAASSEEAEEANKHFLKQQKASS